MGCATSNLNDLPAVALCRQRCAFLDEAIRNFYALSSAHLSYLNSLQSLALSLQHLHFSSSPSPHDFPSASYMKHYPTPSLVYAHMPLAPDPQFSSFPPSHYYGDQTFGYYGPHSSEVASSSQPPPTLNSPWGFDNSYSDGLQHPTNQNLKDIREEEGIPDLEDDDDDYDEFDVVEPVQADQIADADDNGAGEHDQADLTEASLNKNVPIGSMENAGLDAFEVASKIEVQFLRASESGMEIAGILEVGTLPYYRKHGAYQAFSKTLKLVALPFSLLVSQLSIFKVYKISRRSLEDGDLLARSLHLSSTLQKLHLWEKKLYKEVKEEEKIRVLHDQKCRMLKRLDDMGAEFHKVDTTQTSIKNLSTKIRMAIQVVELISAKINKIRDEELWPQVNEFIQGLRTMWKGMQECHRIQWEAIREAGNNVGWMGSRKKGGVDVEKEVINWALQFASWMRAQRRYARALNNWLQKCVMDEAEEACSPGTMGAPPVFVICNRWSQAMERSCEKEVLERMHGFTRRVLHMWEHERLEMVLDRDVERNVERNDEERKLQRQIRAVKKKMAAAFGEVNDNDDDDDDESTGHGLQGSMAQILEAMESFTAMSATLYQELLQTSAAQEGRAVAEH